jgi:hypothetical protein
MVLARRFLTFNIKIKEITPKYAPAKYLVHEMV